MPNPRFDQLINKLGRAGMHALFPNDFELYVIILELVDSVGKTVDFLAFPVPPKSIMYDNTSLVNIKKSLSGISALDTETFIPKNISLAGSFGRKFKLLLGKPPNSEINTTKSTSNGVFGQISKKGMEIRQKTFDIKLKTGYGTIKLLESIIDKSRGLDTNNEPLKLYLYNPTLNHSFLVKAKKLVLNQDVSNSNMIWNYSLDLIAIADIKSLREQAQEGLDNVDTKKLAKKGNIASNQIKSNKGSLIRQSRLTV